MYGFFKDSKNGSSVSSLISLKPVLNPGVHRDTSQPVCRKKYKQSGRFYTWPCQAPTPSPVTPLFVTWLQLRLASHPQRHSSLQPQATGPLLNPSLQPHKPSSPTKLCWALKIQLRQHTLQEARLGGPSWGLPSTLCR